MATFRSGVEIEKQVKQFLAPYYALSPLFPETARGVWIHDTSGERFLDMFSSYSTLNFGHRHPRLVSVHREQLEKLGLIHLTLCPPVVGEFCELLVEFCRMPKAKVILQNTGAEAVEATIKLARLFAYKTKKAKPDRAEIVSCVGSFHGRTYGALSLMHDKHYKNNFGPFLPGFVQIPFGDIDAFKKAIKPDTAAFFVEPIQGEGGVVMPPAGYFQEVRKICGKFAILLIFDEVQTGLGRTGYDVAHFSPLIGCKPDILILGKALGGGLTKMSAVVADHKIMDFLKPGMHGSTFGGDPLGCAVGIEALKVLKEEHLSENSRNLGVGLAFKLAMIKKRGGSHIKEIRGTGLMLGIEVASSKLAEHLCRKLLDQRILCKSSRNVIRVSPPLNITKDEIDWALPRIEKVLKGEKS